MSKNLTTVEIIEFELDTLYTERDLYFSQVKALEAKNVELEEKLEDEIALSKEIEQNYLEAKEKLEIAMKALEFMGTFKHPDYVSRSRGTIFQVAREALLKIKSEGL